MKLRILAPGPAMAVAVLTARSTAPQQATPLHGAAASAPTASRSGGTSASVPTSAPVAQPVSTSPKPASGPTLPVHVSLLENDGGVYGIAMPVIAYFDRQVSDPTPYERATKVTVNGALVSGAWYWQRSGHAGQVLEARYRLRTYSPVHAQIHVDLPIKGEPAGRGLAYDDNLTLSIATGAATVATVDGATERMTVTSDGTTVLSFPVSLGAANTPTYSGTKIVMEKDRVEDMRTNPGEAYYDLTVPWPVRLTNSWEFVHAASWNGGNIGIRSASHGSTNLNATDAQRYYTLARIGDVSPTPTPAGRGCRPGTATATGTCPGRCGGSMAR
jgi:lipoprotein-anchoring transpeptidase ErfK/SrfK